MDTQAARLAAARLEWLVELGADEATGEAPVDRYALPPDEAVARPWRTPARAAPAPAPTSALASTPAPAPVVARAPSSTPADDPAAGAAAAAAADLPALAAAMRAFPCDLRAAAREFVFADGTPDAPLMVIGEAPGRDEDREGRPFVGAAGQLLDRMLQAIGRRRADPDPARAVYIANLLPWRPPSNRPPQADEFARWTPFLRRHVELARPRVLLLAGNTPCQALLGQVGITRLRGRWQEVLDRPAMPTFHPSYVLRLEDRPADFKAARRQVWEDLQAVQARLQETA